MKDINKNDGLMRNHSLFKAKSGQFLVFLLLWFQSSDRHGATTKPKSSPKKPVFSRTKSGTEKPRLNNTSFSRETMKSKNDIIAVLLPQLSYLTIK